PDKHQLKFNSHKDAKSLMEAIEKCFGGNTETKKVQKTLLKQQFENFSGSMSESLDQIHDRLQKLTHTLIWRNKTDLEDKSLDDLFNNLKIYESKKSDEGIKLEVDQEKSDEVEGRHANTQAEIYNIDLDHSSKVLSMQEDTKVQEAVEVVTTAKLITEVVTATATQVATASTPIPVAKPKTLKIAAAAPAVSTRRRKGVKKDQVETDVEYAKKLQEELDKEHKEAYKNIDWNADFDHVFRYSSQGARKL
nr:hypothetical protein [Tanacetum cinerariifolium]